jgi:hypothetical protein
MRRRQGCTGHRRREGSTRKLLSESHEYPTKHEGATERTYTSQVALQGANVLL